MFFVMQKSEKVTESKNDISNQDLRDMSMSATSVAHALCIVRDCPSNVLI